MTHHLIRWKEQHILLVQKKPSIRKDRAHGRGYQSNSEGAPTRNEKVGVNVEVVRCPDGFNGQIPKDVDGENDIGIVLSGIVESNKEGGVPCIQWDVHGKENGQTLEGLNRFRKRRQLAQSDKHRNTLRPPPPLKEIGHSVETIVPR